MSGPGFTLRHYTDADEAAAIDLWQRTWQQTYPQLDFAARVTWWRERWRTELVPQAAITVAERGGTLCGFVTADPNTRYLDQIVVAPEKWGTGLAEALIAEAKRLSPAGLDLHVNTDNARAIRFYEKCGFVTAGTDVNPRSSAPIYRMAWRPEVASIIPS